VHCVFPNPIDDKLKGLSAVRWVEHDGLIQVHVLLRKMHVLHQHHQGVVFMLGVRFAQRKADGPDALKLLGPRQVKFIVIAFAALLERNQFVVGLGNRSVQLVAG